MKKKQLPETLLRWLRQKLPADSRQKVHPVIETLCEIIDSAPPVSKNHQELPPIIDTPTLSLIAKAIPTLSLEQARHVRRLLDKHIDRLETEPKPPHRPEVDPKKVRRACQMHQQLMTCGVPPKYADDLVSRLEGVSAKTVQRWLDK